MSLSTLSPPRELTNELISVEEFHRMIDAGELPKDYRVELLEGRLVPKMTHSPLHDNTVDTVNQVLSKLLPPGWRMRVQSAITTGTSEPEPDLTIAKGDRQTFKRRHPGATDIGVVIEVADSSLKQDRTDKRETYARAGIVCYWIVNLRAQQVEVFEQPSGPGPFPTFGVETIHSIGQMVDLRLEGRVIASVHVSELFA